MWPKIVVLFAVSCVSTSTPVYTVTATTPTSVCLLTPQIEQDILSYKRDVDQIIHTALYGSFRNKTYDELCQFVDEFGSRFSGTPELENSIDYVLNLSKKHQLENVHGEVVQIPRWVRGEESATLLKPRKKKLAMLGLGYSVGTPKDGITAEAIVVTSFDELERRSSEVAGKIVVYNQAYTRYGESVQYRSRGASEAAKFGAVAVLVRSVTPFSLYTVHTGMMTYRGNYTKIPAACITVEDAELLHRMANRGKRIEINIKMESQQYPDVDSRNVVAEIQGSSQPHKVVVMSGHIDSWDVGQGAMDDGGGAFISWGALALLKQLNLRPKRTIRLIMWTGEEMGTVGARQYINNHKAEERNLQLVMESDIGTFKPLGLEVTANDEVKCILQSILKMLEPLGNLDLRSPQQAPDIEEWVKSNVPGASLWNKNEKYFWYHHTEADTMLNTEDRTELDKNTALFAAVSYVVANLNLDFPRNNEMPTRTTTAYNLTKLLDF